jgi:diguanylate cyclase (GGDEF)-like protein
MRRVNVLSIEDDRACAMLLERTLCDIPNMHVEFEWVHDRESALACLHGNAFDVVFLDYHLGSCTGIEVLKSMRSEGMMAPVIMLTAQGDEYVAVEVTRAGADGYMAKQDLSAERMAAVIESARLRAAERVDTAQLLERIDQLESLSRALAESNLEIALDARLDPLTELLNRRAWSEAAAVEHARAIESGAPYVIVMADVDNFKKLNDASGHQAGDECLQALAKCLRRTCRPGDTVGRVGGEEFVMLFPETSITEGGALASDILDAVRELGLPHAGMGPGHVVSLSLGVAAGPDEHGWESVMRRADEALYRAKREGRCRACIAA